MLSGGAVAALTALSGCSGLTPFVGQRTEETRTVPVEDATAVDVGVDVGDVTLRGTDRDDVQVRLVKQASSVTVDLSKLQLRVERAGDELRFLSEWTGGDSLFGGAPSLDLDVAIPRSFAVASIETAVGDIEATDATGDVTAQSRVGDVHLHRVDGAVTASSRTGDVTVREPGRLDGADTRTGDVTVDVPAIEGDTLLESRTGDVEAALAPDLDAELTARTDTGDVSVSGVGLTAGARRETLVTGTLGDGGPALTAETTTGDVTVTSLD